MTAIASPIVAPGYEAFVGRQRVADDDISLAQCRRIAALLDRDPMSLRRGDRLEAGWISTFFADVAPASEIGVDGHARLGDFLPAIDLPRRRLAGRAIELHRPLTIGDTVSRRTTIAAIEAKRIRSGSAVFVTLDHEVSAGGSLAFTERQTIVYLDGNAPATRPVCGAPADCLWEERFTPSEVALFRYSAITFNSHRIHYDRPYATEVEGYRGLVVNGGLTALQLLDLAERRLSGRIVGAEIRALRPLYAGSDILLRGARSEGGGMFWAQDPAGDVAMSVDVSVERQR